MSSRIATRGASAVIAALVVALGAAPTAEAATRRATDREARIRFTLDGKVLTARLLRGAPARVRRQLYGRTIKAVCGTSFNFDRARSEEHTSELQSHSDLVCRLLLEKKK